MRRGGPYEETASLAFCLMCLPDVDVERFVELV